MSPSGLSCPVPVLEYLQRVYFPGCSTLMFSRGEGLEGTCSMGV